MNRKLLPVIGLLLLLLCTAGRRQHFRRFELSGYAQGTTYSIVYYASDSLVTLVQLS